MKYRKLLILPGILIAGAGIFFIHGLAQQSNNGLTIHPSNFELTIHPGETVEKDVIIDNSTDLELQLHSDKRNFTAEGEEGGVALTAENTPFSLASWITVTPESATVPAHKSATFHFKITLPENAEAGGHFGSVVFGTNPKGTKTTGAAISQEVTSLILVKVPGDVKEEANGVSLSTDKNFYEFGPVNFDFRVKNTGAVHIQPFGSIQVKDMFGNTYDAPLEVRNVLPNSIRKIPAVFKNHLLIGHYTGTVIASYGSKNQPLYGSVEFWAFPVRYAAIAGVILLILFIFRKRIIKSVKVLFTGK